MRAKRRQFIVFGLGRFGSGVARSLAEMGHEVLAVDQEESLVEEISPYVTQAVQADATDEQVFDSLDVGGFDAAVVSIGSNVRDSILVSLLCKERGVPCVVAKAMDELHGKVLRKVGVDRVVYPERDMGARVARSLVTPNVLDMMELSGDHRLVEIAVPAPWCDRTLVEINVRREWGVSIIGVKRGETFTASPGADMRLKRGDVLLVLGRDDDVDAVERL